MIGSSEVVDLSRHNWNDRETKKVSLLLGSQQTSIYRFTEKPLNRVGSKIDYFRSGNFKCKPRLLELPDQEEN